MKFLKNNMYTLFALALVMLFAMTGDADAAGTSVMTTAKNKAVSVFKAVKTIVFVVGGFGLVGLGFAAIFGKIKWTWLAALAAGLAIVALAGAVVDYVTDGNKGSGTGYTNWSGDSFGDTLN